MLTQKGFSHLVLLLLILMGISVGLYLIIRPTFFKSVASENNATLVFVFTGESNSGGVAPNSEATAEELASTSSVQILNNTTLKFEDLDIGTNNLLDH